MNRRKILIILFILSTSILLTSYIGSRETVTIGLIPVRDADELERDFESIRVYLEGKLGLPIEVEITESYADLVEKMKDERIDIGWYGAFSYVAAESEMELTPLVIDTRRDSGLYYHSLIITHRDSGIRSINGLKGKKFAFVDSGSTSGFVIPYSLFKSRNIDHDSFLKEYYYAGSHESVPMDILSGKADAGAISNIIFNKLIHDEKINRDDYFIIWKSADIPGSPFVARSELDQNVQENFMAAMLNAHKELPEGVHTFDDGIEKYVEVDRTHYHSIRNIATILGKEYMYEYFLKGE